MLIELKVFSSNLSDDNSISWRISSWERAALCAQQKGSQRSGRGNCSVSGHCMKPNFK